VALACFLLASPAAVAKKPKHKTPKSQPGTLVTSQGGGQVTFSQPGTQGATLTLVGRSPGDAAISVEPVSRGVVRVRINAPPGTPQVAASFARRPGERFLGFGERSDAVVRDGGTVENRVSEGPFQDSEGALVSAFIPPQGFNPRADATYFPIPWVISTRGFGVLIENDDVSRFQLGSPWSAEVDSPSLSLLVFAGPKPADVVRRFSAAVGRQPDVMPEALGPWWQPPGGGVTDDQAVAILRNAGALGSVAETFTHYLPCADHLSHRDQERARTARFAAAGLVTVTYFNPMVCVTHPSYATAAANGWFSKTLAELPAVYNYTGSTVFTVSQVDFRAPGAIGFYGSLAQEAIDDGYVGWMEDFGEYTPESSHAADGTTGPGYHNAYPRDYHGGVFAGVGRRPLIRYVRSGWTGSASSSPVVWGGDPTVGWDFDGLASAVKNGLSMGLSGVSRWGSDIGGFFAIQRPQTTPELLDRWIEVGFASGVMRTEANGFGLLSTGRRAQITDPDVLPIWARYAQLRTRLYPELLRGEHQYTEDGLPIMRQLSLDFPGDRTAVGREDEWMLGDNLLVAPVLGPGETTRTVYLPGGKWIDLWRSADSGLSQIRRPALLTGGRYVTLPAPLDEIPILVRYRAALELLPTGAPSWRDAVAAGQRLRDVIAFGSKRVHLTGNVKRRYRLQWWLPRKPEQLLMKTKHRSRSVPFKFREGILRASVRARRATLIPLPRKAPRR
jgi:alpha-D-xyloside xylohydrolase